MKVKEKIKKVLKALLAIIMFLPHKIYAYTTVTINAVVNPEATLYGVEPIKESTYAKMFAVPIIVVIIGLIVYYKKSKHKISEKIAVTVAILLILCFICFIIWNLSPF